MDHYLVEVRRPAVCLVFVAPILILYEIGVALSGETGLRNGVDLWVRRGLELVGAGEILILPLATAGTLLFLHHRRNDRWRLRWQDQLGMLIESLSLGFILFCAASAQHLFLVGLESQYNDPGFARNWIVFLGAGLYEELLFRLILLQLIVLVLVRGRLHKPAAIGLGIAFSSLLFAGLHFEFLNPAGQTWNASVFVVQFLASIFFCIVFMLRGFGIAVGAHVVYDLLTQV